MMAVNGTIQTRSYEDKNGNKRKAVEIVANDVSFTGSKRDTASSGEYGQSFDRPAPSQPAALTSLLPPDSSGSTEDFEEILGDDDLPFKEMSPLPLFEKQR